MDVVFALQRATVNKQDTRPVCNLVQLSCAILYIGSVVMVISGPCDHNLKRSSWYEKTKKVDNPHSVRTVTYCQARCGFAGVRFDHRKRIHCTTAMAKEKLITDI